MQDCLKLGEALYADMLRFSYLKYARLCRHYRHFSHTIHDIDLLDRIGPQSQNSSCCVFEEMVRLSDSDFFRRICTYSAFGGLYEVIPVTIGQNPEG